VTVTGLRAIAALVAVAPGVTVTRLRTIAVAALVTIALGAIGALVAVVALVTVPGLRAIAALVAVIALVAVARRRAVVALVAVVASLGTLVAVVAALGPVVAPLVAIRALRTIRALVARGCEVAATGVGLPGTVCRLPARTVVAGAIRAVSGVTRTIVASESVVVRGTAAAAGATTGSGALVGRPAVLRTSVGLGRLGPLAGGRGLVASLRGGTWHEFSCDARTARADPSTEGTADTDALWVQLLGGETRALPSRCPAS